MSEPASLYLKGDDAASFARDAITLLQEIGDEIEQIVIVAQLKNGTQDYLHSEITDIPAMIGLLELLKLDLMLEDDD